MSYESDEIVFQIVVRLAIGQSSHQGSRSRCIRIRVQNQLKRSQSKLNTGPKSSTYAAKASMILSKTRTMCLVPYLHVGSLSKIEGRSNDSTGRKRTCDRHFHTTPRDEDLGIISGVALNLGIMPCFQEHGISGLFCLGRSFPRR
eukprot:5975239-Amphidinium_carterae.1